MKHRILLFFLLICNVVVLSAQNSEPKVNKIDVDRSYNQQELDSLLKIVLDFYNRGDFEEILVKVPALIQNAKDIDAELTQVRYLNFLGNTFIKLGDEENASVYFKDALENAVARNDSTSVVTMYVSLGNAYYVTNPEMSKSYYKKALDYNYRGERYEASLFVIHHNLAELYVKEGDAIAARYHLDQIKDKIQQQEPPRLRRLFTGTAKSIEAGINLIEKDYQLAIENAESSLESKEHYDQSYQAVNYKTLIEAYDKLGQYDNVVANFRKYDSLKDLKHEQARLAAEEKAKNNILLNSVEDKLKKAELENDLAEEKAGFNKIIMLFFIILALTLLGVSILLFREKNRRDNLLSDLTQKNEEYFQAKNESEELARSNTRFLSTISHELRTPLYGIVGLTASLLKDSRLKDFQGDLSSLKFSADYLLALVNDVLNINKFSSTNGQEVIHKNFELHRLLNNIRESFRFLNEKHNNTIEVNIDPDVPEVLYTDYTKISQVLMNLMSNASKFTEDGKITMSALLTEKQGDVFTIRFDVIDTGRGIHPDDQKRIFEEFMQVKGTNNFEIAGTGLGIPIVNKILHILDSELELESALNEGSKFSFEVAVQQGNRDEIKQQLESDKLSSLKGLNVLIVDDNKINQLVTKKVLELQRMTHQTASNGKQAVEINKNYDFDFILMDINMPVMDGIEATQLIREYDAETPIIALTATNFEDPETEIYSHGFNAIVVKPYNNEHLIQAFTQQLEFKKDMQKQ